MKHQNRESISRIAGILINIVVIFCVLYSQIQSYFFWGSGNMHVKGTVIFRYFTNDSNILHGISCAAVLVWQVRARILKKEDGGMPYGLLLFRYISTAAVTVTLLTVLFFLGPMYGYPAMFEGWTLYLHLIGPLLAIISLIFLDGERKGKLQRRHTWLTLTPVLLYGAVYLYNVVYLGENNGGWPDFYGFNIGGRWMFSYLIMLAASYLIGMILRFCRNKSVKQSSKK